MKFSFQKLGCRLRIYSLNKNNETKKKKKRQIVDKTIYLEILILKIHGRYRLKYFLLHIQFTRNIYGPTVRVNSNIKLISYAVGYVFQDLQTQRYIITFNIAFTFEQMSDDDYSGKHICITNKECRFFFFSSLQLKDVIDMQIDSISSMLFPRAVCVFECKQIYDAITIIIVIVQKLLGTKNGDIVPLCCCQENIQWQQQVIFPGN